MIYEQALIDGKRTGASRATDAQAMAMLLDSTAQILLGAVSPKLIREGAQFQGLTMLEVGRLMGSDPEAARDLMWAAP